MIDTFRNPWVLQHYENPNAALIKIQLIIRHQLGRAAKQLLLLKYSGSFDVIIYICNAHRSSFGEWKQWVFNFVEEKKAISKEKSRWWLMTASNCQKTCNSCWRTLWSRSLVGAFVLYHEAPEREHWVQSSPEERTLLTLTLHWCLISGL